MYRMYFKDFHNLNQTLVLKKNEMRDTLNTCIVQSYKP